MKANAGLVCINSTALNTKSLAPLFHRVNARPGALQGHHHVRGSIPGKNVASLCCSAPPLATAVVASDPDERFAADVEDRNAEVDGDGDSKEGAAEGESGSGRLRWNMLLSTEALGDAHLLRAGSVTDAHVLRRKGRLKEQDGLIEFVISMHNTHSPSEVFHL